jgi:hypothetical protein
MFVDDLECRRIKKPYMIQTRLQKMLDQISQWMSKLWMQLSLHKTVYCIFNRGGQLGQITGKINLRYREEQIKAKKHCKFLGVTLNPRLNLHEHAKISMF